MKMTFPISQLLLFELKAYHHGEASLHGTIINMAQSFCGSNNINLLFPSGQFGTRRMGGKDAASPRYIFTKLEKITRTIFHPDDDELLTYLSDDGMSIEPEHYMPVIPMVLVNGSDGIGTGWSSSVNNYDPRLIITNIRHLIQGEELEPMMPYYSGYTGQITRTKPEKFEVKGKIERLNETTLLISELPLRKWTQDYKGMLEGMLVTDGKNKTATPDLKTFQENHTDTTVSFTLTADKEKIDAWEGLPKGGLYSKFKLTGSLSSSNMHLFDTEGRIVKYESPESILQEFYNLRMEFYIKRKDLLLQKLRREQCMLSNKARFVEEVCSGELVVSNRKKVDLLMELQQKDYDLYNKNEKLEDDDDEEEEDASIADLSRGYEYLLGMKIWSLTFEKAEELRAQLEERNNELQVLEDTTPSEIWLNDLDSIENALDERDDSIRKAESAEAKAQKKSKKKQQKKAAAAKKGKKKKADEWDSDLEDSDEDEDDFFSDEEEVVKKPPRKPAARKQVAPKVAATKPAVKKTAAKPVAKVQPKIPEVDEIELSLAERMSRKLMVSPPSKKSKAMGMKPSILTQSSFSSLEEISRKRPSPKSSETSGSDVEVVVSPAKPAPKRAKATGSKAAKKKAAPKKKAPPKKKVVESESEDEFEFDSSSEDEVVEVDPAPRRAGRGRATKKPTYFDDFEEEDSDSEFSFSD